MNRRANWLAAVLVLLTFTAVGCGDNRFTEPGVGGGGGEGGNRAGSITGQVTAGGVGVGGVEIVLVAQDSTRTAVTDSQGQYRFANLPSATYTLQLRVPPNYALAAGQEGTQSVELAAGGTRAVNWLLRRDDPPVNVEPSTTTGGGV